MKLTTIEQVQKKVGRLPAPRDLKVIDHVDEHAARWLSYANFGFLAFGNDGETRLTAAGGDGGFVSVTGSGQLRVPLANLDDAEIVTPDASFGALLMVSGMDETLRVNGKVSGIADGRATLDVEECYLHCAKSFRRSDFWVPESVEPFDGEIPEFVTQSSFLVLSSMNGSGQVDASPRGDPAGAMIQENDGLIYFADRPGNRRVDSFRNILERPNVGVLALVPGRTHMLEIQGTAELRTDEHLLQRFEVQGKLPKLVTQITPASMQIKPSSAIAESALWPAQERPEDLRPSEIFKAHIKHSKESSIQAKVARAAVSVPGAMEKGLELDYKKNMY